LGYDILSVADFVQPSQTFIFSEVLSVANRRIHRMPSARRPVRALLLLFVISCLGAQSGTNPLSLAPYYPTPMNVVKKMLQAGKVQAGELVYDLGSGDGRVVIMAAQQFGARAVGFEINPEHVKQSRDQIEKLGLSALASIEEKNLLDADFSKPDLIFVYLLPESNEKLRPLLEQHVRPGTRIVTHDFEFNEWEAEEVILVEHTNDNYSRFHKLFVYRR
jgi:precorrin-6B methylase 2